MVNWIQPAGQSPPDTLMAFSQAAKVEASTDQSFGEILKAREKQEQKQLQESAFSAAAALAGVLRASPAETFVSSSVNDASNQAGSVSAAQQSYSADMFKSEALPSYSAAQQPEGGMEHGDSVPDKAFPAVLSSSAPSASEGALPEDQVEREAEIPTVVTPDADAADTPYQALQSAAVTPEPQQALPSTKTVASLKVAENAASVQKADFSSQQSADQNGAAQDSGTKVVAQVGVSGENPNAVVSGSPILSDISPAELPASAPEIVSGTQAAVEMSRIAVGEAPVDMVSAPDTQQGINPLLGTMAAPASTQAKSVVEGFASGKLSTPATVNVQSSDVVQQVLRQMSATLQSGPASMHLQLHPQDLGAIDVQMIKSAQGVSVTFFAEQASTGRLLESQMDQLRQALTDTGIQLSNLNIGQHGQPGQQSGFFKQASQFAQYPNRGVNQTETETEVKSKLLAERLDGQLLGVDYRV